MALERDPNYVYRDFTIPNTPSSEKWNPRKSDIRQLLTEWWQVLIALVADAGGLEVPNLLIQFSVNPDEGDENSIIAETNLPVPEGPGLAVFSIVIEEANTGPVTINGKPLLSNTGNELVAEALAPDGIYLFLDNGESYRLLSDYVSASIVAAAEAAAVQALDAADRAEVAAQDVEGVAVVVENLPVILAAPDAATAAAGSATTASTQANRAESQADRAEDQADRAESASNNASVNADVYPDVATGRNAVADGDQFQVLVGNEYVRYERDSETTQHEVGRFPSSVALQSTITAASRTWQPRGQLSADANLNTIVEAGTYWGVAAATMTGLPPDLAIGTSFYLTILPYGWTAGSGSNNRFVPQTIESMLDMTVTWKRRLDQSSPTGSGSAWKSGDDGWKPRGQLASNANLNTIIKAGTYWGIASADMVGLPSGVTLGSAFYLMVEPYGTTVGASTNNRFVPQTIEDMLDRRISWKRRMDQTNPAGDLSEWKAVGAATAGRFAGKSIVCFGDSITEGSGAFRYPSVLATLTGANVTNGGFGGCRMAVHDQASVGHLYDPMSMYRLSERIADDSWSTLVAAADALYAAEGDDNRSQAAALAALNWANVDYAIIFYGTNDFRGTGGMGIPIGTDTDATGDTFKGAINVTINNILTARPNIKLMFVTPMWRSRVTESGQDSNVTPNGSGVFLREYCDAIVSRAKAFQIPVLDLHDECGINILNWETYTPDGLHPWSTQGIDLLAGKMAAGLERFY